MTASTSERGLVSTRSTARFVGQYQNKMDAKGRVSVPADFRKQVNPGTDVLSPVLYCCPGLFDPELICGGADLPDLMLEVVATQGILDETGRTRAQMERAVTAFTERFYFDDNGRVVITKRLREHARLEGQVSFAGAGAYFTMAATDQVDDLWSILQDIDEDTKDTLRARAMPSMVAKRGQGE